MARIFLTHPEAARRLYDGDKALAGLQALGDVRLNDSWRELTSPEMVDAARDCALIVSYRQTPGDAALFLGLPDLVAFSRCAIDIRNVDVEAASGQGILVTQASAGFIASVAEWVIGAMIDLCRYISAATEAYHAGRVPPAPPAIEHQALETVAQAAEILQGRAPAGAVNADRADRVSRLAGLARPTST